MRAFSSSPNDKTAIVGQLLVSFWMALLAPGCFVDFSENEVAEEPSQATNDAKGTDEQNVGINDIDSDECPYDPNKAEPGACGCGIPEDDSDQDGVPDCLDSCPADPGKTEPETCGCGILEDDSDQDGVPDCLDSCPADPGKTEPETCGCGLTESDEDRDEVPDCIDACPADSGKTEPGACGCGRPDTDSDNDGAPDCLDDCPADPDKTEPGTCGCGQPDTDSDSDGAPDCVDNCPADPGKAQPGICGCGVTESDLDSDLDGTPDCIDGCIDDPNKTAPGTCGCGTEDKDTDQDGTPDCNDPCPIDPEKIAPGLCGCGISDDDTDQDGTPDCKDLCAVDPNKIDPGLCGCGTDDKDTDQDGTPDCKDLCAVDPNKSDPGLCGCGVQDDSSDTDGDGVLDCNDLCAEDPNKSDPGLCGCGVQEVTSDTDGDGVLDCNDLCAEDPNKTAPGECGCGLPETDTDGDKTPDCHDLCRQDPDKVEPGTCGCGTADIDTDQDGVFDCLDYCVTDPEKSEPGVCGCGIPDTDSDQDGVLDCNDLCVDDSNKSEPGVCGCGVPDVDSDQDGVLDCNDACPEDPSGSVTENWYPDCDNDGEPGLVAVNACGTIEADEAYVCQDGGVPAGGWSTTPGTDCYDEDDHNPCGCGEQDNDGDRVCAPVSSLLAAEDVKGGLTGFELSTGTLPLYVDSEYDEGGWVLIGRGREGWNWSEDGQGDAAALSQGLGTPDAFSPVYLPTSTIQELIDNTGIDLRHIDIRIKRAASMDGSSYQEVVWNPRQAIEWTWLFDTNAYEIDHTVQPSILGEGGTNTSTTYDARVCPPETCEYDSYNRVFTYPVSWHDETTGFSYGKLMVGESSETAFLTYQYAIPYTEVYIRIAAPIYASCYEILQDDPTARNGEYEIDPDGRGGNDPFFVDCDMSGGGWTHIYKEDFDDREPAGWEDGYGNPTEVDAESKCADAYGTMLGGFDILGKNQQTTRTVDLLGIPHTMVYVNLEILIFDKWEKEDAIVDVDGVEQYRETFNHKDADDNVCGKKEKDLGPQDVKLEVKHTSPEMTVMVTSTLDVEPDHASFGIDNIVIKIR